jgi:biopolymer transport protein ExbD
MKLSARLPRRSRIEMMPLIDSFFLILVYFIYAFLSMSVHQGIPLDLPVASMAQVNQDDHVSVSVTREGEVFLDNRAVSLRELTEQLTSIKESSADPRIYIFGDLLAPHGKVVGVLDVIREVGIEKVAIQTDPS